MLTIKIFLQPSGELAKIKKDFNLYQYQYQSKLLDVYVPVSITAPEFTVSYEILGTKNVLRDSVAGTSVTVFSTSVFSGRNRYMKSKTYAMKYIANETVDDIEYYIYEIPLPKEFTYYNGVGENAPIITVNVQNIDMSDTAKTISLITSQNVHLDVLKSDSREIDTIEDPSAGESLNARVTELEENIAKKQNIYDSNLETNKKEIVPAINEVNTIAKRADNTSTENTSDITDLQTSVSKLEQIVGTGEDYVGTLYVSEYLPPESELNNLLNAFVRSEAAREPKVGDVVIVVLGISNATDKNYKYIYSSVSNGWGGYEIPPIELAGNGTNGIVRGIANTSESYSRNTYFSITDGVIDNMILRDDKNVNLKRFARDYIFDNKNDIAGFKDGSIPVAFAQKAEKDGLGFNINTTYMRASAGATKTYVKDYALPRQFNDVYYLNYDNKENSFRYLKTVAESTDPIATITVNSITYKQLYAAILLNSDNDATFELSKKNSSSSTIYISSNRDMNCNLRIETKAFISSTSKTIRLSVDVMSVDLKAGEIKSVTFKSYFTSLGEEIITLDENSSVEQTLEILPDSSVEAKISVYSNPVYSTIFNLNISALVVTLQSGYLGEQPIFRFIGYGGIVNNAVTFYFKDGNIAQIKDNVECEVTLQIPIDSPGYSAFGESTQISSIKTDDFDIVLETPYNTNPVTFGDIKQAYHSQNDIDGIVYTMKCFMKVNETTGKVRFIVDEDNLSAYATHDYVEKTSSKHIILGADLSESDTKYIFTAKNPELFTEYKETNTEFLVDLHIPVEIGAIDKTKRVAIVIDDAYGVYDILKGNKKLTIGDLSQVENYNSNTGYRFIFKATYFSNSDITGFFVIPTVSTSDILSLSSDDMDTYVMDGGLTDGQLAVCSVLGTAGGYEVGALYKYKIDFPYTYSWVKLGNDFIELTAPTSATNGTLTDEQFAKLKENDTNGILFDHEYYKMQTKGHIEGYRTYCCLERENNSLKVKTITITENVKSWVLVSVDVEEKQNVVDLTVQPSLWTALSSSEPYTYMCTINPGLTLNSSTEVGIINNNPVLFAKYGFVIGSVSGNNVIIYSIGKPTDSIVLSVGFRG